MKVLPEDDLIGQATPCNMYLYNIEMCFVISIHIVNKLKLKIEIDSPYISYHLQCITTPFFRFLIYMYVIYTIK